MTDKELILELLKDTQDLVDQLSAAESFTDLEPKLIKDISFKLYVIQSDTSGVS